MSFVTGFLARGVFGACFGEILVALCVAAAREKEARL